MSIIYTIINPVKNTVMTSQNISDFHEGEHGIYFVEDGAQRFVNWNVLGTYTLVEEEADA